MKTSDFNYNLPKELIAQSPIEKRDHSRMMLLEKETGRTIDSYFYELDKYINKGDCLVLNDSRVLPARLIGQRVSSEYQLKPVELLLLRDMGDDCWECLAKPGKKLRPGTELVFGGGLLKASVKKQMSDGNKSIKFYYSGIFIELLEKLGRMPLPPYITEYLDDSERYQTIYSKKIGSAAAPTAGLHFTVEMLEKLQNKGVNIAYITLHVGLGTFRPVSAEDIADHIMHSEYYIINEDAADKINRAKNNGGKVVAVGTTSLRTIESSAVNGSIVSCSGWTNIFIYPGYSFKITDALLTNFHLPESTLIMLVSALAGKDNVLNAYHRAVDEKYRFFSFGDCMLILDKIPGSI